MTELNKIKILIKFWLWGAMHSPHFHLFTLQLDHFPVELEIHWSEWTRDLFMVSLTFYIPELLINAPHAAEQAFINVMKDEGIEITLDFIDGIPF